MTVLDRDPTSSRPAYPTSHSAGAALYAASSLSSVQTHSAMLPEALLLALLHDPAIHDADGPVTEDDELRTAILDSDERGDADGWSARARDAYARAWARARTRERERPVAERLRSVLQVVPTPHRLVPLALTLGATLSAGDLLAGLAGAGPAVDRVLRRRALDPSALDVERPPPAVGDPSGLADDAPVDILALDDDITTMVFVVEALQAHIGCSAHGALYLMYLVNACGRARVSRCTRAVAERRVRAVDEAAKAKGFPLKLLYGPRVLEGAAR